MTSETFSSPLPPWLLLMPCTALGVETTLLEPSHPYINLQPCGLAVAMAVWSTLLHSSPGLDLHGMSTMQDLSAPRASCPH